MGLPTVLAGPILRRVEPTRVCVWLATSAPAVVRATVGAWDREAARGGLTPLGVAEATSVQLGERLFVHLVEVTPAADAFPVDRLLAYDVTVQTSGAAPLGLADLGLLDGPDDLAYGDFGVPTFFVRGATPALRLLHGSCRLLHGKGEDALVAADETVAAAAGDVAARPAALLLTGDQIYGDEVAGALIVQLRTLADALCGAGDATSVPDLPPLSGIRPYGRAALAARQAAFTSGKADNHLFSFGEFAAMYVSAWNSAVWPQTFPPEAAALPGAPASLRRRYDTEVAALEQARAGLPAVRRVLANTPTYMIFDDHDVTDDWNITAGWRDRVAASPTGRRVVANALAAFWAFQGWGNEPALFDAEFRALVERHLAPGDTADGDRFDSTLWSFDRWSYVAPTDPPTVMLDTRSQRSFDSPEGAARLIRASERQRLVELCRAAGHRPGDPLVLVSPVPVYGLELQERRQKFLVGKVGPYEIDFEAWHSNLAGLVDFLCLLVDELRLPWCVVLSGDVHYGMNVAATVTVSGRRLPIAQLVSSSFKHSGALSRMALEALGGVVTATHVRVGWQRPPAVTGAPRRRDRVLRRAANTDAWDDDSPVFLAPRHARRLGITQPPDYREFRRYLRPVEHRASVLIGENNVGVVALYGDRVTHLLLGRRPGETRVYTTTMPLTGER